MCAKPWPCTVTRTPPAVRPAFGDAEVTDGTEAADAAGAAASPTASNAADAAATNTRLDSTRIEYHPPECPNGVLIM
jgi:hypothetical protein